MKLLFYLTIFLASFTMSFYTIDSDISYIKYGVLILVVFGIFYLLTENWKKVYLRLSDCDGMCEHCNKELREVCKQYKSI